ncbi:MAG: UDP-glucose 4-epimerase GalE, partial [Lactobacillus crispatus]|nr:UDP-glucose 4-epimerase GalE [Lactobacillus crispatus]
YTMGPRRGGDPDSLVADSTKARTILGWKPKHESVDDVIATAWNWHKSHPKGYEDK